MKRFARFLLLVFLLIASSCSHQSEEYSAMNDSQMSEQEIQMEMEEEAGAVAAEDVTSSAEDVKQQERMVIFQGEMTIEVENFHKAVDSIKNEAEKLGGYIVESSYHEVNRDSLNGTIIIRVPQPYFHSFLDHVASTNGKVLHQSTTGNDITEEFVDLDSRLKSKRVVEERLLGFMEQAETTESLLKISNDLAKVQEEIEQIVGRMNYLENQVALSTLTFYIEERNVELTSFQEKDALNTWGQSKQMFIQTINMILQGCSKLIVLFVGLSPILIPISGVGAWLIWLRKQRKKTE